jgi:hypothetical protein
MIQREFLWKEEMLRVDRKESSRQGGRIKTLTRTLKEAN